MGSIFSFITGYLLKKLFYIPHSLTEAKRIAKSGKSLKKDLGRGFREKKTRDYFSPAEEERHTNRKAKNLPKESKLYNLS